MTRSSLLRSRAEVDRVTPCACGHPRGAHLWLVAPGHLAEGCCKALLCGCHAFAARALEGVP